MQMHNILNYMNLKLLVLCWLTVSLYLNTFSFNFNIKFDLNVRSFNIAFMFRQNLRSRKGTI